MPFYVCTTKKSWEETERKKGLAVVLSLMMVLGILPFGLIRNNIAEAAETEVSTDDYSGTYYIATKRSSGNYFYMTNELGTASTKRYQAVDSGLTTLPESIASASADAAKTFTLSKTADGYTITDSNGKYLAHNSGNSGALQDGAFYATVDLLEDGTFNIHYTASDAERYLSLNSNSSYNYFAWYKSGQSSALSLIPVIEGGEPVCEHTNTTTVTVDATCTEEGSVTVTCDDCGVVVSTETIPAAGHNYDAVVTAPTCTEPGYTTYTCSACGDSYVADEVAALGHTEETTTTAATCETDGSIVVACTVCGETISTTVIPAFGHSYEYTSNNDGTHNAVCANDASHVIENEACDLTGGSCPLCGYTESATDFDPNFENADVYVYAPHVASDDITVTINGTEYLKYDIMISDYSHLLDDEFDGISGLTAYFAWDRENLNLVSGGTNETAYYWKKTYFPSETVTKVNTTVYQDNLSMKEGLDERGGDISSARNYTNAAAFFHACEMLSDSADLGCLHFDDGILYTLYFEVPDVPDGTVFHIDFVNVRLDSKNRYYTERCLIELLDFQTQEIIPASYAAYDGTITIGSRATTPTGCYVNGHTLGEYTQNYDSLCWMVGDKTAVCSECGYIDHQFVPLKPHTPYVTTTAKEPTCTEDGTTEGTNCYVCGYILEEAVPIPATGHTPADALVENVVKATCDTDGSYDSVIYCETCGEEISRETTTVPATGHDYGVDEYVDATIFAEGGYQNKCKVCGEYGEPVVIPQLTGVITLGAQALSVTWDSIRFAAAFNVDDMKATFDDGDTFELVIYVQLMSAFEDGIAPLDDTNAVKISNGQITWSEAYETMTTEQLVAALRAQGANINSYNEDQFIVAARINNVPSEDIEFAFRAAILSSVGSKSVAQMSNSIANIRDAIENGNGTGASTVQYSAQ